MNFVALAVAILTMYTSVSTQPKDSLGVLWQVAVENDIMEYIELKTNFKPSDNFKQELMSFLKKHGKDNACNRKFLEILLINKTYDDMVETVFKIYAPVSKMARCYDSLSNDNKAKVRSVETRILNILKNNYDFKFDYSGKKDFIIFIREHGDNGELNRKLLRQFFSCTKSKLFEQIVSFMKPYKQGISATELRRKLQADPNIFSFGQKPRTLQHCHSLPVRNKRTLRGGKKALI